MSVPQVADKKHGLRVLAVFLLLLGGIGIYLGSDNYPIRVLGAIAILASVCVLRIYRSSTRIAPAIATENTASMLTSGPGRLLWIISFAMVPLLGAAWFLLHVDAVNGGHQAWPVDVFAGVALICCVVWSFLYAKIRSARRMKNFMSR